MALTRDPLSVHFDPEARRLLRRALVQDRGWTGTYLALPGPQWITWGTTRGIGLFEHDERGEVRWVRGFKRSVYHQAWWYLYDDGLHAERRVSPYRGRALRWETGRLTARGWAIRIKLDRGGAVAWRAVQRKLRESYVENPGERSTSGGRDW